MVVRVRRRDVQWMLEQQEKVVRGALEAVSETVARTVASVLEVTLGPSSAVEVEAEAANNNVIARLQQVGKGLPDPGYPAWGEAPLDDEQDPDPTDLDKPFDSYQTWDPTIDLESQWESASTSRSAFLRPGESPIPSPPA